jgi:hypothetical protein
MLDFLFRICSPSTGRGLYVDKGKNRRTPERAFLGFVRPLQVNTKKGAILAFFDCFDFPNNKKSLFGKYLHKTLFYFNLSRLHFRDMVGPMASINNSKGENDRFGPFMWTGLFRFGP